MGDSSRVAACPPGFAFVVLFASAIILAIGAAGLVLVPAVAKVVFLIGFLFALGMLDRARDRALWCWTAILFGSGLALALLVT